MLGEPSVGSISSAKSHDHHSIGEKAKSLRAQFPTCFPQTLAPSGPGCDRAVRLLAPSKHLLKNLLVFPAFLFMAVLILALRSSE